MSEKPKKTRAEAEAEFREVWQRARDELIRALRVNETLDWLGENLWRVWALVALWLALLFIVAEVSR